MDRRDDNFRNGMFSWFTGEVLKVHSDGSNRVKVFPHGYYDEKFNSTEDDIADKLPWATVMMPPTTPGIGTVDTKTPDVGGAGSPDFKFGSVQGMNHSLEVGSHVVGFFRDGPSAQDPIIMGVITGTDIPGVKEGASQYFEGGTFTASDKNKVMTTTGTHSFALNNESGDATVLIRKGKLVLQSGLSTEIEIDGQTGIITISSPSGGKTKII